MGKLRWGVLSTAGIGRVLIEESRTATHAEVVAVASRDASRARAFAGEPERVWADQVRDGPGLVDLRLAATMRLPGDVLALFDVGLDLTRRDELELVGTEGRLTVPDPWLCRATHLELSRDGQVEHVPVDPDRTLNLTDPDHDVYRIELDTVSAALAGGGEPSFGRADAIAQATVLEAIHRSAELETPVALTGL
jgi:D-xylose 1-dehydrogenase (NADP+, D-xylono-1,5-lactone-forming)